MADKSIGELPQATQVQPESLIPLEQDGQAMRMSGEQFADFAKESVSPLAQKAEDSANTANESARRAESARDSIEVDEQKLNQAVQDAQSSASQATAAQTAAESAKTASETANTNAQTAKTAAQHAARDAKSAQTAAQTSAAEAESAADRAENAATTAESIVAGNEAYTKRESDLRFAVPIVEGASGEVIAVTDSAERPLHGLKVFGKTIQDGTPAPDAPAELVSVGDDGNVAVTVYGKNLLLRPYIDGTSLTANGITCTVREDGSIAVDGTASATNWFDLCRYTSLPIGTYKVTGCPPGGDGRTYMITVKRKYTDGSIAHIAEIGGGITFNVDETIAEVSVYVEVKAGITIDAVFYPMFCLAEFADNAYEPYKPAQTLTVSTLNGLPGIPVKSGGNYTDANGQQWVCDEVDFVRGVYVQRVKTRTIVDTNGFEISATETSMKRVITKQFTDGVIPDDSYAIALISCSHYQSVNAVDTWRNPIDGIAVQGRTGTGGTNEYTIFLYDDNYQTLDAWNTFFAEQAVAGTPVTIQYALATPIETALSAEELAAYAALHTNYPNTTVFNDGGAEMEVKYAADTKLYIDNKFAQLAAAIVNNT